MKEQALFQIKSDLSAWPETIPTTAIIDKLQSYSTQPFYAALIMEISQYIDSYIFKSRHCRRERIDYAFGVHRHVWKESTDYTTLQSAVNDLNPLTKLDTFKILLYLLWQEMSENLQKEPVGFIIKLSLFSLLLNQIHGTKAEKQSSTDLSTSVLSVNDGHDYWIDVNAPVEFNLEPVSFSYAWVSANNKNPHEFVSLANGKLISEQLVNHFSPSTIPVVYLDEISEMSNRQQACLLEDVVMSGGSIEKMLPKCRLRAFTTPASHYSNVIITTVRYGNLAALRQIFHRATELLQSRQLETVTIRQLVKVLKLNKNLILLAASSSQTEIMEYLLLMGLSPNAAFNGGYSALHIAAAMGNDKMVHLLRRYGAESNYAFSSKLITQTALLEESKDFSLELKMSISPDKPYLIIFGYPIDLAELIGLEFSKLPQNKLLSLFPEKPGSFTTYINLLAALYIHSPYALSAYISSKFLLLVSINYYLFRKTQQVQENQQPDQNESNPNPNEVLTLGELCRYILSIFKQAVINLDDNLVIIHKGPNAISNQIIGIELHLKKTSILITRNKRQFELTVDEALLAFQEFSKAWDNSVFEVNSESFILKFTYPLISDKQYADIKADKLRGLLSKHCSAYNEFCKSRKAALMPPKPLYVERKEVINPLFEQNRWNYKINLISIKMRRNLREWYTINKNLKRQLLKCQRLIEQENINTNTRQLEKGLQRIKQLISSYQEIDLLKLQSKFKKLLISRKDEQLSCLINEMKSLVEEINQEKNTIKDKINEQVESCEETIQVILNKIPQPMDSTIKIQTAIMTHASESKPEKEAKADIQQVLATVETKERDEVNEPAEAASSYIPQPLASHGFFDTPLPPKQLYIEKYALPAKDLKEKGKSKTKGKGKSKGKKQSDIFEDKLIANFEEIERLNIPETLKQPALCGCILGRLLQELDPANGNYEQEREVVVNMRHILRHHLTDISIDFLKDFNNQLKTKKLASAILESNIYNNEEYQNWLSNKKNIKHNDKSQKTALWFLYQQLTLLKQASKIRNELDISPLLRCLFVQIGDQWKMQSDKTRKKIRSFSNPVVVDYLNELIDLRNRAAHHWTVAFYSHLNNKLPELDDIINELGQYLGTTENSEKGKVFGL